MVFWPLSMNQQKRAAGASTAPPVLKTCPWCGGSLKFDPIFPVARLVTGDSRPFREADIPASLLAMPAWVCATPLCRYREPA
jgi:hypothetical protein